MKKIMRQEKDPKRVTRLHVMILAKQLKSARYIAQTFGYNRDTIHAWVACYHQESLERLSDIS